MSIFNSVCVYVGSVYLKSSQFDSTCRKRWRRHSFFLQREGNWKQMFRYFRQHTDKRQIQTHRFSKHIVHTWMSHWRYATMRGLIVTMERKKHVSKCTQLVECIYPVFMSVYVTTPACLSTCMCGPTGTVSGLSALLSWASRSSRGCWDWRRTQALLVTHKNNYTPNYTQK